MTGRRAIEIVRRCIEQERYSLHEHFTERMDERGLFFPDVLAIIDRPRRVRMDGRDDFHRPRCLIAGNLTDGAAAELLAVIDRDDSGDWTIFITIYWDD